MIKQSKHIIERIASYDNLLISVKEVIKGNKKRKYKTSQEILNNLHAFCDKAHYELINGLYKPKPFRSFEVIECGKLRNIQSLCIYDRIILHAIMNILGKELFINTFIRDTYASIKGRGIIDCLNRIKNDLGDVVNTQYCLKLDIRKFYNSIDRNVLLDILNSYIGDKILLKILKNIINSYNDGLPLGYHSSQYLGNFYLSGLDRYIKDNLKVKYYYRYCDDMVILSGSKKELHILFNKIKSYVENILHLTIKSNYQVFPVDDRGIDFLGFVIRHNNLNIRKRIVKKALYRLSYLKSKKRIWEVLVSINGWYKHSNNNNKTCINILDKIKNNNMVADSKLESSIFSSNSVKSFKSLGISQNIPKKIDAIKISTNDIINIKIILTDAVTNITTNKYNKEDGNPISKSVVIFEYPDDPGKKYKFITSASLLIEAINIMKENNLFPVSATIKKISNADGTGKSYLKFE